MIPSVATNIRRHHGTVTADMRSRICGGQPGTLWMTGLSGAGKSTLAFALERELVAAGIAAYVLDGDNMRHGLNADLSFSDEDRRENVRRVAEVARLFNDAGLVVIAALIAPYRADREMAREIIGADRFIEIHVATPREICEARDPKGLYRKATNNMIQHFPGVSSPYEAPEKPALVVDAGIQNIPECLAELKKILTLVSGLTTGASGMPASDDSSGTHADAADRFPLEVK